MQKKIIKVVITSSLTSILIGASIAKIVLGSPNYMGGIQKVTFFSQSPSYRDKGFNELTYNGTRDYAEHQKEMVGNTSTEAYSDDGSSYVNEIANVYDLGANTIVSSGFNIASAYSSEKDTGGFDGLYKKGYDDKTIIAIDDNSLANINKNAISINFKSQDAGFIAGVASSIYTVYAEDSYNLNPSIAVWGGLPYSTVFDWLSGLEQAINWFNYQILGFELDGTTFKGTEVTKWSELVGDHKSSFNLHGKTCNGHKITDKPLTINNAGDITVDYTKAPPKGSNDGVNFDPKSSFYTGGFGFDPNDQASGSNAAVKIKKINSRSGKDAIVFPVAGGQTMETLANLSDGSKTMIIGVDSDAEAASPNYGDNILGSATKNISKASNFGTWYSQNRNADVDTQQKYTDPDGMTAKEFIDTWSPKDESGHIIDTVGTQFTGNFQNDGVSFEDNNSNKIGFYLSELLGKDVTTKEFLVNIMPDIFDMNNNIIEASSETFVIQDGGELVPLHATDGMSEDHPWIPDWNIYKNI